jgi:hypothetical protein
MVRQSLSRAIHSELGGLQLLLVVAAALWGGENREVYGLNNEVWN